METFRRKGNGKKEGRKVMHQIFLWEFHSGKRKKMMKMTKTMDREHKKTNEKESLRDN